jgi:hypothetical protein
MKWTTFKKRNYLWVTLALFFFSIIMHWMLAWKAYVNEQKEKKLPIQTTEYLTTVGRDTMENWQSEFLQLIWQVAGLSMLFYVGSPTSKEGDQRKEAKLDYIIKTMDPDHADKILREFDKKYPKN